MIYGRRALRTGEAENYRVRLPDQTPNPIEYVWDFGDGTLAEGNNVVHRYRKAGRYRIAVTIRNPYGSDADTFFVTVTGPPVEATPPADAASPGKTERTARAPAASPSAPPGGSPTALQTKELTERAVPVVGTGLGGRQIAWQEGGYAWRMRTHFELAAAERQAREYQNAGYRVGIITDESGPGSTVYRVVIGQFDSVEKALRAKPHLPYQVGVFLTELSGMVPDPPPSAGN